jgi:hypothetical protein
LGAYLGFLQNYSWQRCFFVISRLRLNVSLKDLLYGLIQADSAVMGF